jgi:hypothetical protein
MASTIETMRKRVPYAFAADAPAAGENKDEVLDEQGALFLTVVHFVCS